MEYILRELVLAIKAYNDAHPVEVDEETAPAELKRYWDALDTAEKYLEGKA